MNLFSILGIIVLISAVLLFLFTGFCLHAVFGKRCEEDPNLNYLTEEDFPDLITEKTIFRSGDHSLAGAFYRTCDLNSCRGLILFLHGMGAGHHSYMTEIHTLAAAGYLVFAYDNTGCVASGGERIRSFYQGTKDADAALQYINTIECLKALPVGIMGHSWGAYNTCQSLALASAYRILAAVALSPLNKPSGLLAAQISAQTKIPAWLLRPFLAVHLLIRDGEAGIRSCSDVLHHSMTPVLLYHGMEDTTVTTPQSPVSDPTLTTERHIIIRCLEGRYHNVYQSQRSEAYLNETFAAINRGKRSVQNRVPGAKERLADLYARIDYELITEENPVIMEEILQFLSRHVG